MISKNNNKIIKKNKQKLGEEIKKCRGKDRSRRNLAIAIGIPPSNMKYIEDGINAPSSETYTKITNELKPSVEQQKKMDELYLKIRKVPPPDVCEVINTNSDLFDIIRILNKKKLNLEELNKTKDLFTSFVKNKGETIND